MTWVKVCGITSSEAVEAAESAGADAIGLVLSPNSPRVLSTTDARRFASSTALESFIVTVDQTPDAAIALAAEIGASGIQNHGRFADEVAVAAVESGLAALRPIPVGETGPETAADGLQPNVVPLFDTASPRLHGGTGSVFDWSLLGQGGRPFVVAGGLGPDNVATVIRELRPFGVDASSRLESAPGVKDPDSIRSFVREAKRA